MLVGSGTAAVPVRSRLAWLLLSVPGALAAAALALADPGRHPLGHWVGAAVDLAWVVALVATCLVVRRRGDPVMTLDRYGLRLPYLRLFAPWSDVASGAVKHKGEELVVKLREGGGVRLPRPGREASLSGSRPRTSTLRFPQVLVDVDVPELAEAVAAQGVPVDRPPYRRRTTLIERASIGAGLVLLFLSSQKVGIHYQTVYFWAGLAVIGCSFLGRRSFGWAMAAVVSINVVVLGFVVLVAGPAVSTRATAFFTVSLSLGALLAVLPWPYTPPPPRSDD
jgi:hypothetical protein